jgi:hypothetical protein
MAATFCTEAELRANLSLGSLYTSATVEETCQAGENIIKSYLWFNKAYVAATKLESLTATITTAEPHGFSVGESVVISDSGSAFNGTYTIVSVTDYVFTYTVASGADQNDHLVRPYGVVTGPFHGTVYSSVPEIKLATLMVCTEIWQAKQAANGGALDPSFQPSPFKMGSTLIAKVRGLLANHLAPNGLIG